MAIHYSCRCGATARLPNNAVGKRARCNSCGYIFTVPVPKGDEPVETIPFDTETGADIGPTDAIPLELESNPFPNGRPKEYQAGHIDGPRVTWASDEEKDIGFYHIAPQGDILEPPIETPPYPTRLIQRSRHDEERDGVTGPSKPYLQEVIESFWFFINPGNTVTFVIMVFLHLGAMGITWSMWNRPLRFGFGFFGGRYMVSLPMLLGGYLGMFYMAVIKEVASGEDELPNPWPSDLTWGLVTDGFYFMGSTVLVLIPAVAYMCIEYANFGQVTFPIAVFVASLGLLLWPAMVLCVSIGGGFNGIWPHILIRTALAEPLAYLLTCFVILLAVGLCAVPSMEFYQKAVEAIAAKTGRSLVLIVALIQACLITYAMLFSMRVIGLYYRHFKQKFPWTAE